MSAATAAPTLSGWQGAQRYALARATRATPSQRARSVQPATAAVLAYVLACLPPARVSVGKIAEHTGLTRQQVTDAIADMEGSQLENGAMSTGRLSIVVPSVLAALGLDGWGLASGTVRPDAPPAGTHVEITDAEMTEAFA